jgi:hypothetical protein
MRSAYAEVHYGIIFLDGLEVIFYFNDYFRIYCTIGKEHVI